MAKSRLLTTVRDMVLTLVVVGVPIGAAFLVFPTKPGDPAPAIDAAAFSTTMSAAQSEMPFKLLAPQGLPSGWRATSETYEPAGETAADWHLGYLTPAGAYVSLEQTSEGVNSFLADQHADATADGSVQAGGQTWQRYEGTTPSALRTLLVRTVGTQTEIVAGSAPLADIESFAAALQ